MMIGQTVTETIRAFRPVAGPKRDTFISRSEAIARIVFTLLLLLFAFYLYDKQGSTSQARELAALIVGGVIGYWLR